MQIVLKGLNRMTVRRKIMCTIFFAIIITSTLITVFTLIQMHNLKNDMVEITSGENDKLYSDNVDRAKENGQEISTLISDDMMEDFKQKLETVESDLAFVKENIEQVYREEIELSSNISDEESTIIRSGVNYNDISAEFNKIKGVRSLIKNVDEKSSLGQIYYSTDSGITIFGDLDIEYDKVENADRRTRSWYDRAVKSKGIYWSEIYIDVITGKPTLTCSIPVYGSDGSVKGVVANDIHVDQFTKDIFEENMDIIEFAFMMKHDGTFLIGSKDENIGIYLSNEGINQVHEYIKKGDTTGSIFVDNKYMLFGSSLDKSDIFIGILLSNDDIFKDANEVGESISASNTKVINHVQDKTKSMIIILAVLIVISILISLCISLFVARTIVNPISVLTAGVKKISEGDLDYTISVNTNDEIKDLSVAFNNMTKEIKEYINNLSIVTADKERIATELNVARKIQSSMLPCIFPPFPNNKEFDIMALMNPAKEVGGDFYDFFLIDDDHLAFLVADVSGKGVPAALFMVVAKTLIKNNLQHIGDPAKTLNIVNNQLCENNEANMFVTAFVSVLNIKTGELTYCNAGHNPPLVYYAKAGKYEFINPKPNFILAAMKNLNYKNEKIRFEKGGRMFCYTDGITEAMNKEEQLYSEKRLLETLNNESIKNASLKSVIEFVRKDIEKFANGSVQFDDITMILVERK